MKKLAYLILASFLVLSTVPGCAFFENAKSADTKTHTIVEVVYNGLSLALSVVDVKLSEYIDSIPNPSEEELAMLQVQVDRLARARAATDMIHDYLTGEKEVSKADLKTNVFDGASALELVIEDLEDSGVSIPKAVTEAVSIAKSWSKSG